MSECDRKLAELMGMSGYRGCSGQHQHGGPREGHAHGHGTMWYEGDPNKLHHHHDIICLRAKDAEIASLRAEVEKEKLRAKKHLNQLLEACDRCVKIEVVEGDKLYKENMALRARCEAAEAKAEQLKAWIVGCKNVECMRSSKKSLIVAALVSDDPC